jgi:hypothetical protein
MLDARDKLRIWQKIEPNCPLQGMPLSINPNLLLPHSAPYFAHKRMIEFWSKLPSLPPLISDNQVNSSPSTNMAHFGTTIPVGGDPSKGSIPSETIKQTKQQIMEAVNNTKRIQQNSIGRAKQRLHGISPKNDFA